MKRLVILIMVLLFAQLSEAKTILYVANAPTTTPCSELSSPDSLYCARMANLGYNMVVIDEENAVDNSTTWNEYVADSDAIFLGSDSADMANKKKSMYAFCGNISAANKPLFVTSVNTWITKPDTLGCGIFLGIVSANFSSNSCSAKAFKTAMPGFITEGLSVDENVTIYASANAVRFYNVTDGGWITAECTPVNYSIDFYPVLYADNRNVFWGLDSPSSFSSTAWSIFDRTVLSFMNDTTWSITAFTLPSVATVNQNVLLVANVTQVGKPANGTVNFTTDVSTGVMAYSGLWKSTVNFNQPAMHYLNVTAYSKSLRGFLDVPLNVGTLAVNITSGSFRPNSNYTINASIQNATQASYRILDPNYNLVLSGSLSCSGSVCTGVVSMPDVSSLLLEVTASGSSVGGAMKTITKGAIATDKDVYAPGDTVTVDFFSPNASANATLTIVRPDGTKEIQLPMDTVSSTHFSKNYTLGTNCSNGTYSINIKTAFGNYNKTFDVIVWNSFAYLNKNAFDVFDTVTVTAGIAQAYTNQGVNLSATITSPDGNATGLGSSVINGDGAYAFSYQIPGGYPSGVSKVVVIFKDPLNRSSTIYLNFSTNVSLAQPSLSITPSTVSITTIPEYPVERTVTLKNSAGLDATVIVANSSWANLVVLSAPSSLSAGSSGDVRIRINANNLTEGNYTGYVNFYSRVGDASLAVTVEIVGDLSSEASEKYAELSSIESNLTYLSNFWANTSDSMDLLDQTKGILNRTINEYKNGDYVAAKADLEEATANVDQLQAVVTNLYGKMPTSSYAVWYVVIAVVVVIVTLAAVKLKGKGKKKRQKKSVQKEEPKKEEVFYEPKGGEYRTEYY